MTAPFLRNCRDRFPGWSVHRREQAPALLGNPLRHTFGVPPPPEGEGDCHGPAALAMTGKGRVSRKKVKNFFTNLSHFVERCGIIIQCEITIAVTQVFLEEIMKKIVVIFLVMLLVIALAVPAMAAGTCYFAGPQAVRAGDTITLTFYADGNVTEVSGKMEYDTERLTLQGYETLLAGSWEMKFDGDTFHFRDHSQAEPLGSGKALFKATFLVNADLPVGTTVNVFASGVTLKNNKQTEFYGGIQWSKSVAQPLNSNADLAYLNVSNATITPAFDPNVTEYTATVSYDTERLEVSAYADYYAAKATVGDTALAPNATTDVTVTVTAENGTTKTYHILVTRPVDPTQVPSDVTTLEELTLEGFLLSPVFDPLVMDYTVYLPNEVDSLQLAVKATNPLATVEIPNLENIPVGKTTYQVVVTAPTEDVRIYTITTVRAEPFEGPYAETEPVTEPTVEETEPETEPTETKAPAVVPSSGSVTNRLSGKTVGALWILSVVAAFLGGFIAPMLLWNRE